MAFIKKDRAQPAVLPKVVLPKAIQRYGRGPHLEIPFRGLCRFDLYTSAGDLYDLGRVLERFRYLRTKYLTSDASGLVVAQGLTANSILTENIICTNITPVMDDSFDVGDVWGGKRFRHLGLNGYLQLGHFEPLPPPAANLRGKLFRVEDAAGDRLYICEWNGAAYVHRQI